MNIPMLQACIEGYQEHIFSLRCIAVHAGYWAGYYRSKKSKSPNAVIEQMMREHNQRNKAKNPNASKPPVDVERFEALELKRKEYLARKRSERSGRRGN